MIKKSAVCPLKSTEKRLLDCIDLFVELKKSYFEPEEFRLRLNTFIQTFRTVTWILQKNKALLNGFDDWYKDWQYKMRADPIMKWSVNARNTIVKKGDLETNSKVRITIVESWLSNPIYEVEINPFTKTEDFAKMVAKTKPDSISLMVGLLRVERRWVDSTLPNKEILESIAYSFQFVTNLLQHAHSRLLNSEVIDCPWQKMFGSGSSLPFMLAQDWDRSIWLDLETGQQMTPSEFIIPTKEYEEAARERYPMKNFRSRLKSAKTLKEEVEVTFQHAKEVLEIDGHHVPLVIIGYPDKSKKIFGLDMADRAEKHLLYRKLAAFIEKTKADSIIFIGESWLTQAKGVRITRYGIEGKEVMEVLNITAANSNGDIVHNFTVFNRDQNGKICFCKEFKLEQEKINFLSPILKIWGIK